MIITYDDRYCGFAPAWGADLGDVAVMLGKQITGLLWWKKVKRVFVVKTVRRETSCMGGHIDTDDFWRVAGVFEDRDSAYKFASEIRGDDV
jgi:hypothetical protein